MPSLPRKASVVMRRKPWPLGGWGDIDSIRQGLSIDTDFWRTPEKWPHDPLGYVFLARAVDNFGKAMFGAHWTGKEWTSPVTPDIEPGIVARRATVQQEIATLCETGGLVFGLRPKAGGDITESPTSWWNAEPQHFRRRFYRCEMDANAPFRDVVISPNNSWIFIERDSLDKELVRHPFAPTPSLEDRQLSPYLITMLSVTKQLRITPEQQLTIKEIEKEIRAAWKGRFEARHPLSQNLCEKMATFVREPESQRGRAAKKKNLTVPN